MDVGVFCRCLFCSLGGLIHFIPAYFWHIVCLSSRLTPQLPQRQRQPGPAMWLGRLLKRKDVGGRVRGRRSQVCWLWRMASGTGGGGGGRRCCSSSRELYQCKSAAAKRFQWMTKCFDCIFFFFSPISCSGFQHKTHASVDWGTFASRAHAPR